MPNATVTRRPGVEEILLETPGRDDLVLEPEDLITFRMLFKEIDSRSSSQAKHITGYIRTMRMPTYQVEVGGKYVVLKFPGSEVEQHRIRVDHLRAALAEGQN